MRILLDENTPRGVRRILASHDVRTAPEMGWAGVLNGQLLDEAEKAGFDALVTCDQNIVFQQNLVGRNIAVVVLSTNRWATIRAQPQSVRPSPTPHPEPTPSPCSAASVEPGRLRTEYPDPAAYR